MAAAITRRMPSTPVADAPPEVAAAADEPPAVVGDGARRSPATIAPPGPLPVTVDRSRPSSPARRRAYGDARSRPPSAVRTSGAALGDVGHLDVVARHDPTGARAMEVGDVEVALLGQVADKGRQHASFCRVHLLRRGRPPLPPAAVSGYDRLSSTTEVVRPDRHPESRTASGVPTGTSSPSSTSSSRDHAGLEDLDLDVGLLGVDHGHDVALGAPGHRASTSHSRSVPSLHVGTQRGHAELTHRASPSRQRRRRCRRGERGRFEVLGVRHGHLGGAHPLHGCVELVEAPAR